MTSKIDDEFEGRPHLVRRRARAEFWGRLLQYLWTFMMFLILILVFFSIKANNEDKANLIDCTTADGECYQENQKQSAILINDLVERISTNSNQTRNVIIIALWCDDQADNETIPELTKCVNENLQRYGDLGVKTQDEVKQDE